MGTTNVSIDFSSGKYTDMEFTVKAKGIIEKMTGNLLFPDPIPILDVVRTAFENFFNSLDDVGDGSKHDTIVKNNYRKALENLLKQLGSYVQWTSMGDPEMISTSGFDIHQKHDVVGPLEKPKFLHLKAGDNRGSVELTCNVVPRADFYEFEYMEGPAESGNAKVTVTSTKHKVLIEGLVSGKLYIFRVAGAGSDRSRKWSNEVSSFIM
jgi:hypothetical protein